MQRKRAAAAVCLPPLPGPSRPPGGPRDGPQRSTAHDRSGSAGETLEEDSFQVHRPCGSQHTMGPPSRDVMVSVAVRRLCLQCRLRHGLSTRGRCDISGDASLATPQAYQLPDVTRSADLLVVAVGCGCLPASLGLDVARTPPCCCLARPRPSRWQAAAHPAQRALMMAAVHTCTHRACVAAHTAPLQASGACAGGLGAAWRHGAGRG